MKKMSLDKARLIAALLIIAIHTYPLMSINGTLDFIFTRVLFRVAVPLFLMITGYFIIKDSIKNVKVLIDYTKKILLIYGLSILIYLPINLYIGTFHNMGVLGILKNIFITGTFYHLWYFPALILGLWLTYLIVKNVKDKYTRLIFILLFVIGLFGDSYYGVIENIKVLKIFYDFIFKVFDYTRNGIFYVPIFLYLGYETKVNNWKLSSKSNIIMLIVSTILLVLEGLFVRGYGFQYHSAFYIMLIPVMMSLFTLLIAKSKKEDNPGYRMLATVIYIIHPVCILLVRFIGKILHLTKILVNNSIIHFITVVALTLIISLLFMYIYERAKTIKPKKLKRRKK